MSKFIVTANNAEDLSLTNFSHLGIVKIIRHDETRRHDVLKTFLLHNSSTLRLIEVLIIIITSFMWSILGTQSSV